MPSTKISKLKKILDESDTIIIMPTTDTNELIGRLNDAESRIRVLEADISNAQKVIWSLMGCPRRVALPAPAGHLFTGAQTLYGEGA